MSPASIVPPVYIPLMLLHHWPLSHLGATMCNVTRQRELVITQPIQASTPPTQRHAPVLLNEAVDALSPRDGAFYVDATFGAGGYSRAILAAADCRVLGLDRDPRVRPMADGLTGAAPGRFVFAQTRFSAMEEACRLAGVEAVDGVVLDVGVSSMQLDQAHRGFSFQHDGPLDMRMGDQGPTAADAVSLLSEGELADVLYQYGDERKSRRIAKAIVTARTQAAITTTVQLAEIVTRAVGRGDGRIHPATRTFQALRILVNDELGELAAGLAAAERILRPGGRLVVVSFHSLEDRLVKGFLRRRAGVEAGPSRHAPPVEGGPASSFRLLATRAVTPEETELLANPRARSAKLRAGVRTDAEPIPLDERDAPRPIVRLMVEL